MTFPHQGGDTPSPDSTSAPRPSAPRFSRSAFLFIYDSNTAETIGPQLLWNANRNSYAICQMAPFPATFNDSEARFQRSLQYLVRDRETITMDNYNQQVLTRAQQPNSKVSFGITSGFELVGMGLAAPSPRTSPPLSSFRFFFIYNSNSELR